MKLKMFRRAGSAKSELGEIRRAGNVPAILYTAGKEGERIAIDGVDLKTVLRTIVPGRLPTTRFTLVEGDKEISVIPKEIQYHPTTYQVMHMDFMVPQELVKVRVPIECAGAAECQGIKLGGFLRQVVRYARVECPASAVPEAFSIDIRDLVIGQSKRLSDLAMPQGVRPLDNLNEVIVVIAKR